MTQININDIVLSMASDSPGWVGKVVESRYSDIDLCHEYRVKFKNPINTMLWIPENLLDLRVNRSEGETPMETGKTKKLAIVNGAPASEMLAPFDDPDYDIWVLGNRLMNYPLEHVDMIFEIHDDLTENGDPVEYATALAKVGIPLIVGEGFPVTAEHVQAFDFEADREYYGSTYQTSSTTYMISEAARRGYQHIELYGVDMAIDEHEYFMQRPCLESWIGFVRGKGVDISVHESSPVGKSDYVEGLGCGGKPNFSLPPFTQSGFCEMKDGHKAKMDSIEAEIEKLQHKRLIHFGAFQTYERMEKLARTIEMGQPVGSLSQDVRIL